MRPGRTSGRPGQAPGFILVDVLAALAIAAISLATVLGGIGNAVRLMAAQEAKVSALVEQENERVAQAPGIVVAGE